MSVDLRFSDVDPPDREPKRTVYADIVNLPDPVKLGLTVRIFNYDEVFLYMKVDGYNGSWSFTPNELGAVSSGTDRYFNLDVFGTRARPASETSDIITVRLRAYTDSGYSDLKWTFERSIEVSFIKSNDGSWTLDELDNFDDGTVQGWSAGGAGTPTLLAVTDYVLSPPYSLRGGNNRYASSNWLWINKTFSTPDKAMVFAVADVRYGYNVGSAQRNRVTITVDGVTRLYLGSTSDAAALSVPWNRWMRLVFPLPPNSTPEIRLRMDAETNVWGWTIYEWLDDFQIISKN